jgi:anti-anti-sigma factor
MKSGVCELVIDLSAVTYMDSASLGCLMDICRVMSTQNGVVKLVGLHERLETLAFVAGLTRFIGVSGDDGIHLRNLAPFAIVREKGTRQ